MFPNPQSVDVVSKMGDGVRLTFNHDNSRLLLMSGTEPIEDRLATKIEKMLAAKIVELQEYIDAAGRVQEYKDVSGKTHRSLAVIPDHIVIDILIPASIEKLLPKLGDFLNVAMEEYMKQNS